MRSPLMRVACKCLVSALPANALSTGFIDADFELATASADDHRTIPPTFCHLLSPAPRRLRPAVG
jgi:hypothetical protein